MIKWEKKVYTGLNEHILYLNSGFSQHTCSLSITYLWHCCLSLALGTTVKSQQAHQYN